MGANEIFKNPPSIIIISWFWSLNQVFGVLHKNLNMQDDEDTTEEIDEILLYCNFSDFKDILQTLLEKCLTELEI